MSSQDSHCDMYPLKNNWVGFQNEENFFPLALPAKQEERWLQLLAFQARTLRYRAVVTQSRIVSLSC